MNKNQIQYKIYIIGTRYIPNDKKRTHADDLNYEH